MASRIVILFSSILFFVPGFVLILLSYPSGNGDPETLSFLLVFPFIGTCPFPINGNVNISSDVYYWPEIVGLATAGLGIAGITTGRGSYALIFLGILFFSWILTLFRFIG
jgi:hypothetical protein